MLLIVLTSGALAQNQGPTVRNSDTNSPRHVHFLLCGLTKDDQIGDSIKRSLADLEHTLRGDVAQEYIGTFKVLRDDDCDASKILEAVRTTVLTKNDALCCYYLGHGAYDPTHAAPNDTSIGHHFQIPSGDLMRYTLLSQMQQKNARLTVLISDTCNVLCYARPIVAPEQRVASATIHGNTPLETLLLLHRGVIDISAASQSQYSWFSPETGGWFSAVVCIDLPRYDSWNTLFTQLKSDSDQNFRRRREQILANPGNTDENTLAQLRGQQHMIPQAFHFDVKRDGPETLTDRERTIERTYTTWSVVR